MTAADHLLERLERACADLTAPFAIVDLGAMRANAASLLGWAGGKPIRVASKSLRCRPLLERILSGSLGGGPGDAARAGSRFAGAMTYTLDETLWLHERGLGDLLLAYPTVDAGAIERLGSLTGDDRPAIMVDCARHLDAIVAASPDPAAPIRVCIEIDMGFELPRGIATIGPKRSPIRTPAAAAALAREIAGRGGLELHGVMGYEGHIAGVGDRPLGKPLHRPAIRLMQSRSAAEIAERRAAVVAAVSAVAPLRLVNGGGTGSLQTTARETAVTELAAGSGFYAPTLFDRYSAFSLQPAAFFALPVVRRPRPDTVTLLGGGYHASGPAGRDRLPTPFLPAGLKLDPLEGAGEVQTPVKGAAARTLEVGDRVYMRHAKAGELCEHFASLHLIEGDAIVDEVPTYRGEGRAFL